MGNLIYRCNSVITGDDGVNLCLLRLPYQVVIDAVSVLDTVRNPGVHPAAAAPDSLMEDISRHNAVDVVISDNPYAFLFFDFSYKNIR